MPLPSRLIFLIQEAAVRPGGTETRLLFLAAANIVSIAVYTPLQKLRKLH